MTTSSGALTISIRRSLDFLLHPPDVVHPPRPARRPVHGHHPDCPYGHQATDPQTCGICQAIIKGDADEPSPILAGDHS